MAATDRIRRRWIVFAVLAAFAFTALYLVAVRTVRGQAVENSALRGADLLFGRATANAAGTLADVTPLVLVVGVVLSGAIALLRRRPSLAVAAVGSIAVTSIATRVLKNVVLTRPDLVDAPGAYLSGSFPSGHTSAIVSIVFGLAMVVPGRVRTGVLVVGGIVAIAVGNLTMAASWHRGSDVLGSDLIALASASIACAWLAGRAVVGRAGSKPARSGVVRLLVVASIVAAVSLVVLAGVGIQYFPNDSKDLTTFFAMQVLAASASTVAVVGFSIAWRGLDIGGGTRTAVARRPTG